MGYATPAMWGRQVDPFDRLLAEFLHKTIIEGPVHLHGGTPIGALFLPCGGKINRHPREPQRLIRQLVQRYGVDLFPCPSSIKDRPEAHAVLPLPGRQVDLHTAVPQGDNRAAFAHVGLQRLYTSGGRGFPRHRPGQRCLLCNGAAAHHEQCDQPSHHFAHVHSPPCRMNPDRIPTFIQRSENGFSFLGCRPKKSVSAPFNRRMPAARPPVPQ